MILKISGEELPGCLPVCWAWCSEPTSVTLILPTKERMQGGIGG